MKDERYFRSCFILRLDVILFVYKKLEYDNIFKLEARMARDLSQFIMSNLTYFQSFSKVILYYDNGQHELNRILNTVLATQLVDYDVRKVIPNEYRLFLLLKIIKTRVITEQSVTTKANKSLYVTIIPTPFLSSGGQLAPPQLPGSIYYYKKEISIVEMTKIFWNL